MFGEKILDYWDDIVNDLKAMVAIPSVCAKAEGEYPFGKNAAEAIDLAMELSKKYDLKAKNVGYYACHAEIGEGEENAIVMDHLDVVPAGEGWETDPFEMVIKDGQYFGRGVSDNKGPAIIALHCLRALKDSGVKGKRKLRLVLGSGEEIGMEDMEHYFASEQAPDMGFTPDGGYGICHCEKGILRFTVSHKNDSAVVKSFKSGTVVNAVPYKAEAEITCTQEEYDTLLESAAKIEGDYVIKRTDDGASILSKGLACHAAAPQGGVNAASHLIDLLYSVFGDRAGKLIVFAYKKIGLTYDGSKIGVKCEDEPSGSLTFNLGIVDIDKDSASLIVDIRYPATKDGEELISIISSEADKLGVTVSEYSNDKPLYIPKNDKLIELLSKTYEDVTGEHCEVFSMGGGTYARTMNNKGVAFGAGFPGEETRAHNCNEFAYEKSLKLHAQICLEAMYRLYTAD